jgi:hypothetical protein
MRDQGEWFHYSIDYRIGTAYMGEHITDNLKRQAMQVPFLADLLRSDSIYIGSNITFGNLAPLSTFLGKPGRSRARAACPSRNTCAGRTCTAGPRSTRFWTRPVSSAARATSTAIPTWSCDTGGSICEVVDPADPRTRCCAPSPPIPAGLDRRHGGAYRRAGPSLRCRAQADVLPPDFLPLWQEYLDTHGLAPDAVDPDAFVRFAYARALAHRAPLYAAMARKTGACQRHRRRGRGVRDAADVTAWWPPPLADTAQTH